MPSNPRRREGRQWKLTAPRVAGGLLAQFRSRVGFAVVDAFIDLVLRSDKASKYGEENMATIPKDFRRVIVAASVGNVIEV